MSMSNYYFEKTGNLDKDKFAELVLAAKGNRTMRDFAVACDAAPSTFTRIIQKINKGPSSPDLLQSIAENADPKSGVTLEMLAAASGYSVVNIRQNIRINYFTAREAVVNQTKAAITVSLVDRGAMVRFKDVSANAESYKICAGYHSHPDFHISSDAFSGNQQAWLVYVLSFSDLNNTGFINAETIFTKIGEAILLSSAKEVTGSEERFRFSFAIAKKSAYDNILKSFGDLVVPVDISIILIDSETNSIVDEYMLPHVTHGHRPGYFVTTEPVINHQSSELYEDDIERRCDNEGNP